MFATGQVINLFTSGANYAKMAYIISDQYAAIKQRLLFDMGLGGTRIQASGMYTDEEKQLIMTVVRNRKITQIKRIVHALDPDAFMIITSASEVLGEGFMPMAPNGGKG